MKSKKILTTKLFTLFAYFTLTMIHAQSSNEYSKLGDKKAEIGNYKGAIKKYKRALQIDPNNIEILEKNVFAKSNCSKYRDAIEDMNMIIELQPKTSKFYYLRGFLQFKLKNYSDAILDYSNAIVFQKDIYSNLHIFSERGLCKMYLKYYSGAIKDFNYSFSIYPDSSVAKYINEAEIKLKENPPPLKYRAVETKVHHIFLKKPVTSGN